MIPLRDNIPSERTPVVNFGLIGVCAAVFLLQVSQKGGGGELAEKYGMIPARITAPDQQVLVPDLVPVRTPFGTQLQRVERPAAESPINPWLTFFTSMFLHGGWLHVIGNLWFLYIFGDNVEDRFGHLGYLLFYVGCGLAAGLLQFAAHPGSSIPTIGASGAIAGVMGSYFLLYPRALVEALVPLFVLFFTVVIPAPFFLGLWFVLQFLSGLSDRTGELGGVAWWAHIGGFAAGLGVTWLGIKQRWLTGRRSPRVVRSHRIRW